MKAIGKRIKYTVIYCLATLLTAALLLIAARLNSGFAEWYALHIFPVFPHTLGRLFSLLPFSVFELLLLVLTVGLLYCLVMLCLRRRRARLYRQLRRALPPFFCALCSLLLLFTLTCGINYSRGSIAAYVGIEARLFSADELRQLYHILAAQAQELSAGIETDAAGCFCLREQPPHHQSRQVMRQLGQRYTGLAGYYPNPKPVLLSRGMSWLNISGIYSPFTVEANYNRDMPDSGMPFSICHELAHLSGFAREDEANFIAYLACAESDNADFRYSGNLYAILYVLNALYAATPREEYAELYRALPAQIQRDLQQNSAYWQQFAGPAAQISQEMNDAYLKANDQPEGVESYGRMVDLLLAYYLRE